MNDSQIFIGNKGFKSYLIACTEQLKKTPQIEILSRGNLNAKAIHLAGCLQEEQNHVISDIQISRRNDNGGIITELKIVVNKGDGSEDFNQEMNHEIINGPVDEF